MVVDMETRLHSTLSAEAEALVLARIVNQGSPETLDFQDDQPTINRLQSSSYILRIIGVRQRFSNTSSADK